MHKKNQKFIVFSYIYVIVYLNTVFNLNYIYEMMDEVGVGMENRNHFCN